MANYYSSDERDNSYGYASYPYYTYGYRAGYYDASGSVSSSYSLGTGESAYGYISNSADKDYYSLGYLSSGSYQYTVTASGTSWASNTSSGQYNTPDVKIYDVYGNLVKSGSYGSVSFKPTYSGNYYVAVSDSSPSQYKLTLSETYVYNYAPNVSSAYAYLNENSSAGISVHDVYAYDYDGDSITYAIYSGNTDVDGDGKLAFSIRSSDGLITVNDAGDLNYEAQSSFSLGVSASDGSKTGYGTVSVYLNDVNEGPTLSSYVSGVNENSGYGTYVGYVYTSGYSGTVNYSITGGNTDVDGDGSLPFYVAKSSNGWAYIYVNDTGDLNYEARSYFDLKVSATDYYGTATTATTVYLSDVNEGPTLSASGYSINENSGYGTYAGYVYTSSYVGTVNYSITDGNTDVDGDGSLPFYIAKSSNGWAYIYVNDTGDLNYESRSYFDLKVSATDYYGTATTATTVYLSDVNEGPTLSASGYSINENSGYGTYAGYVYTSSYVGTVNYSITGGNTDVDGDGSLPFYVAKSSNGWAYIYVNDAGDLNYENQSYFDLKVSATDYYGTATTAATVSLVNVNEASTGSVVISGSAVEGQVLEVASTVQDPDGMGSTTIQWLRDESVISGATSSSYTLTAADVGKSIAARLSYTDGGGFAESRTSAAVTPVGLNPGVSITGSDKTTGEDGNTAVFSVKLETAPVDPVTIKFAVSDDTEAKLSAASLTFTKANWNVAQSLTVTGLDDYDNDSNVAYNLTVLVETSDLSYKRVTVSSIALTNDDDKLDASIYKYGTDGIDYLTGSNAADRLYGRGSMDDLRGGRGDDRLYGDEDDDVLYGDDGDDWVYGGYDDDLVDGGSGNDELYGEQGADTLKGGSGNDTLDGGTGADSMVGGAGNDTYYVDNANDVIDDQGATTDEDTVIVTATVTYKLAANVENAELEDTSGAASLTGNTLGNDLTGNDSKNTLDGGAGSDVLDAGAGNDTLLGGDGTDSLTGGLGNDSLNGGTGDDLVDYSDAAAGFVNVNLATGSASGDGADTLVSIEDVIGSDGNDTIVGSAAGNELTGGLGDDSLNGGGGADVLYSGTGNDTVDAGEGDDLIIGGDGAGNDKYIGGAGIDTVKYTSATAGITVDLIKGTATSTAGNDVAKIGTDTLTGIENVIAGNYDDIVKGSALSNILTGGLGTDSLYGGIDKVKDIFDFNAITESKTGSARDKVYNFVSKLDKLDLSGIDANTATAKAGDQAFVFNGTTAKANSVWYKVVDVDGNTATKDIVVYGDVDGNATADFEIGLVGVTAVVATDFVL